MHAPSRHEILHGPRLGLLGLLLLVPSPLAAAPHGSAVQPPLWSGPGSGQGGSGARTGARPVPPMGGTGASSGGAASPRSPSSPLSPTGQPLSGARPGLDGAFLDSSSWTLWWERQKEAFLELRGRLASSDPITRGGAFYLGHGAVEAPAAGRGPDRRTVTGRVLPALQAALAHPASNDVASASLIAIARIGEDLEPEARAPLARVLAAHLADPVQEVSETAALALGLLGATESVPLLVALMQDDSAGRAVFHGSHVPDRTRVFAAYGLGLAARTAQIEDVRRYVVERLSATLEAASEDAAPDMAVACAIAIGRVPLPWRGAVHVGRSATPAGAGREAELRHLLAVLQDEDQARFVRAQAAVSVAALLEDVDAAIADGVPTARAARTEALDFLLAPLESPRGFPREVVQSAAIAAGMLGDDDDDPEDVRIRAALLGLRAKTSDEGAERFAVIALGRVAGRAGEGPTSDGVKAAQKELLRTLARGHGGLDDWAALALALLERGRIVAGRLPGQEGPDALRRAMKDARAPEEVSALAIAEGIVRDPEAVPGVAAALERSDDQATQGYCAVALGLLGDQSALEGLRSLLARSRFQPVLLREVAIALGLLGDAETVDVLLERFAQSDSLAVRAAIAQALGRIGDARAVDPLLGLLGDGHANATARALAAAAVGLVCDQDALPFGTIYSLNTNYLAAPPTLTDPQGRGVLDIL